MCWSFGYTDIQTPSCTQALSLYRLHTTYTKVYRHQRIHRYSSDVIQHRGSLQYRLKENCTSAELFLELYLNDCRNIFCRNLPFVLIQINWYGCSLHYDNTISHFYLNQSPWGKRPIIKNVIICTGFLMWSKPLKKRYSTILGEKCNTCDVCVGGNTSSTVDSSSVFRLCASLGLSKLLHPLI